MARQPGEGTNPMDLTVVVPTRDRPDRLARCLAAIGDLDPAPGAVVVVDSASRDPAAVADVVGDRATLVRCSQPGASRARNAGFRAAATPIVAFVDDDVRLATDWVPRIVAPFVDDHVVVVTGSVRAGEAEGDVGAVAVTDDVLPGAFDACFLGNVGASANLALRRTVLEAVDGFDALLGAGGRFRAAEDLDLIDRALDHGGGWHAADAVGFHDQWRTRRELLRLEVDYGLGFGVRLSKLLRADPRRGLRMIAYEGRRLLADLGKDLVGGYQFGVVTRSAWATAVAWGLGRGLLIPMRRGHLQA